MSKSNRLKVIEVKINVTDKETVFDTQTLRDIQTKLRSENKPIEPFDLKKIQKIVSAIDVK